MYIYTREFYPARKGITLTHATAWMNLEHVMLSEKNRHKDPHIVGRHLDKLLIQAMKTIYLY